MKCVVCDELAGYNRAVIDRVSERRIGGLCMNCERAIVGDPLEVLTDSRSTRCLCCDGEGRLSLPRYLPVPERIGDDVVVRSRLEDVDAAPTLCPEHARTLTTGVDQRKRIRR